MVGSRTRGLSLTQKAYVREEITLHYCCEKITNGSLLTCRSFVVVEDSIVYYRLYPCNQRVHNEKIVQYIDNFTDILANKNNPLSDTYLENSVKMIQKFHSSLKKRNEVHKTLETVTRSCFKHLDLDINFSRGILMQDFSLVFFHDFSRGVNTYLESVIKKGSL